jgi:hypothetical protein
MLIVLVILAVLTLVAVQSLGPVANEARIEATRQTLENVRTAIIGKPGLGSQSSMNCFVAQHGRLPTEADRLLLESYFLGNVVNLGEVEHVSSLRDGWGKDLDLDNPTASSLVISSLQNLDDDVERDLTLAIQEVDWQGSLVLVQVESDSPITADFTVSLQHSATGAPLSNSIHLEDASSGSCSFVPSMPQPLPVGLYTLTLTREAVVISTQFWLSPREIKTVPFVVPASLPMTPPPTP